MKRDEIVEIGYELAKELCPKETALQIHMRQMFEEFTRKFADRLIDKSCNHVYTITNFWGHEIITANCQICGGLRKD